MSGEVNIYKTAACLDAYTKDGTYVDPIFKFEPIYFRGDTGQSRDVQVFLRNDGDTVIAELPDQPSQVIPVDLWGTDESTWIRLSGTQAGLEYAVGGDPLAIPELHPGDKFPFWIRATVPPSQSEEDKRDVRIKVDSWSLPLVTYMNGIFSFTYDVAAKANNLSIWYDIEA